MNKINRLGSKLVVMGQTNPIKAVNFISKQWGVKLLGTSWDTGADEKYEGNLFEFTFNLTINGREFSPMFSCQKVTAQNDCVIFTLDNESGREFDFLSKKFSPPDTF